MKKHRRSHGLTLVFSLLIFNAVAADDGGTIQQQASQDSEKQSPVKLSLPKFFSDNMVIQRERAVSIWGNADAGAKVELRFKNSLASTKADTDGKWTIEFQSGEADSEGSPIVIASGDDSRTIQNVLVGEVWFASGQSNMAFTMDRFPNYREVVSVAVYPGIRMFNAPTVTAVTPQDDIDGRWTLCDPGTVDSYSAVAFFFAKKLHDELRIPIGVIRSAWGGKPVETFTSRKALNSMPATKTLVEKVMTLDARYDHQKAYQRYEKRLKAWEVKQAQRQKLPKEQRSRLPRKPNEPKRPLNTEGRPGVLFNSMIHPFIGYTIRGAIWYQGESNAKPGAVPYDQSLPLMIRDWRDRWNEEFSFLFVQLANFRTPSIEPGTPDDWALLQNRMRIILDTTPKTGMAVINDVGDANDIHPKNKKAPGERLALWALANEYGRDIVFSGPLYQSSQLLGGSIEVTFDHVGSGLKSRDGQPLQRFEIAGSDQVWKWGEAEITSPNQVIVSHPDIPEPKSVRYAWASNPEGANLVNSEGLPTSVFCTDP